MVLDASKSNASKWMLEWQVTGQKWVNASGRAVGDSQGHWQDLDFLSETPDVSAFTFTLQRVACVSHAGLAVRRLSFMCRGKQLTQAASSCTVHLPAAALFLTIVFFCLLLVSAVFQHGWQHSTSETQPSYNNKGATVDQLLISPLLLTLSALFLNPEETCMLPGPNKHVTLKPTCPTDQQWEIKASPCRVISIAACLAETEDRWDEFR